MAPNGYVFESTDTAGLDSALNRALAAWFQVWRVWALGGGASGVPRRRGGALRRGEDRLLFGSVSLPVARCEHARERMICAAGRGERGSGHLYARMPPPLLTLSPSHSVPLSRYPSLTLSSLSLYPSLTLSLSHSIPLSLYPSLTLRPSLTLSLSHATSLSTLFIPVCPCCLVTCIFPSPLALCSVSAQISVAERASGPHVLHVSSV
eukprot:364239-Chlamydomonas_euryale.AAC.2